MDILIIVISAIAVAAVLWHGRRPKLPFSILQVDTGLPTELTPQIVAAIKALNSFPPITISVYAALSGKPKTFDRVAITPKMFSDNDEVILEELHALRELGHVLFTTDNRYMLASPDAEYFSAAARQVLVRTYQFEELRRLVVRLEVGEENIRLVGEVGDEPLMLTCLKKYGLGTREEDGILKLTNLGLYIGRTVEPLLASSLSD